MKKILKLLFIVAVIVLILLTCLWGYLYFHHTTPILMYHSLDATRVSTYAAVTPRTFLKQMEFIKRNGYNVIGLEDYCRLVKEKQAVPRNAIVITFDDGYKDNLIGIVLLKNFDFPATIFIIVDRIGTDDHLSQADINWFLKNTQVTIGSHTMTHPDFLRISEAQLTNEIGNSKKALEALFSREVTAISYPTGVFTENVLKEVENSGYACACATNRGFSKDLNRFALRRIKVTNRDTGFYLWAKLSGFYNVFKKPKKPY
jgi:peptidoglycan/xylan/chitin deacetylase (PgdA/CDA1 family)